MNEEKITRPMDEDDRPVERDRAPKKMRLIPMKVDNCARVNMRAEPSFNASIVKTLDRDTVVHTDPSFRDEHFVAIKEAGEVVGFIKKDFLSAV